MLHAALSYRLRATTVSFTIPLKWWCCFLRAPNDAPWFALCIRIQWVVSYRRKTRDETVCTVGDAAATMRCWTVARVVWPADGSLAPCASPNRASCVRRDGLFASSVCLRRGIADDLAGSPRRQGAGKCRIDTSSVTVTVFFLLVW